MLSISISISVVKFFSTFVLPATSFNANSSSSGNITVKGPSPVIPVIVNVCVTKVVELFAVVSILFESATSVPFTETVISSDVNVDVTILLLFEINSSCPVNVITTVLSLFA